MCFECIGCRHGTLCYMYGLLDSYYQRVKSHKLEMSEFVLYQLFLFAMAWILKFSCTQMVTTPPSIRPKTLLVHVDENVGVNINLHPATSPISVLGCPILVLECTISVLACPILVLRRRSLVLFHGKFQNRHKILCV